MRIFVTGATGFIGSAVVNELISAGHEVLGLVRPGNEAAELLSKIGVTIHRGCLEDLDSLRRGAAISDGVIHTALMPINDFSTDSIIARDIDLRAIKALGDGLANSDRPLVVTSTTALLKEGRIGTEADHGDPTTVDAFRIPSEEMTLSLASKGVRTSIVRLPPCVYGNMNHGFVPVLIDFAKAKGLSAYIGNKPNRWPAVHRLDAAVLYRLALEKAPAGSIFHSVAEEGILFRNIAEAIGRYLNLPVSAISSEEADKYFGYLTSFASLDCPASSTYTKDLLGWMPVQTRLISEEGTFNN